jgi:hypothetical protein
VFEPLLAGELRVMRSRSFAGLEMIEIFKTRFFRAAGVSGNVMFLDADAG